MPSTPKLLGHVDVVFGSERDLFKTKNHVRFGVLSEVRLVSANLFLAGYVKRSSRVPLSSGSLRSGK